MESQRTLPAKVFADWIATYIGVAITQAREDAGMTQRELAAASGVSQSCVSRYERGLRTPLTWKFGAILNALNLRIRIEAR